MINPQTDQPSWLRTQISFTIPVGILYLVHVAKEGEGKFERDLSWPASKSGCGRESGKKDATGEVRTVFPPPSGNQAVRTWSLLVASRMRRN